MKTYLLGIMQPDGTPPPPAELERIMTDVRTVVQDLRTSGAWRFNGGLHPVSATTVVHSKGAELLVTDGPYTESKEHLGGFVVIQVADLDAALHWAGRFARATTLPIEVRPFQYAMQP